jgi:fatty-acyl-CoA synthase
MMLLAAGFTEGDVALGAAPFTRMGGVGVTVLPTLFAGGSVVIPPGAGGNDVLHTIEDARITVVFANPDLLERMRRSPRWLDADLTGVRTGVVGGGLVPAALLGTYLDRGVPLRHGYGMTEASPVVSLLDADEVLKHPLSVGRPLAFVDVRAVRPDGSVCEPGELGEWEIRGPNVSAGYRGLPSPIRPGGWFPTGDLGWIDADGYLTFADRASSVIRLGGHDLYPATLEDAIYGSPGVEDVAVVDVEGAVVVAIVSRDGVALDRGPLRERVQPHLPSDVALEVTAVASIPRNAADKIRRDQLRAMLAGR